MLSIILLISAVLAFSSCQSATIAATEESPNPSEMTISLEENRTTGYSWTWSQMGAGHLELVRDNYTVSDTALIGAGGTREFTFKGTEPGHVTLSLTYSRSSENESSPATEIYSITVHDDLAISYR